MYLILSVPVWGSRGDPPQIILMITKEMLGLYCLMLERSLLLCSYVIAPQDDAMVHSVPCGSGCYVGVRFSPLKIHIYSVVMWAVVQFQFSINS